MKRSLLAAALAAGCIALGAGVCRAGIGTAVITKAVGPCLQVRGGIERPVSTGTLCERRDALRTGGGGMLAVREGRVNVTVKSTSQSADLEAGEAVDIAPGEALPRIRPALEDELRAMANADEIATSI